MSRNARVVDATPDEVWAVLCDGWLYASWVVGAARIRDVDQDWPAPGCRIHHSVGAWPLLLHDDTEVLDAAPGSWIRLRARLWPVGEAEVTFSLSPAGPGTELAMEEQIVSGPGAMLPAALTEPALAWRNRETLNRLRYIVERRRWE